MIRTCAAGHRPVSLPVTCLLQHGSCVHCYANAKLVPELRVPAAASWQRRGPTRSCAPGYWPPSRLVRSQRSAPAWTASCATSAAPWNPKTVTSSHRCEANCKVCCWSRCKCAEAVCGAEPHERETGLQAEAELSQAELSRREQESGPGVLIECVRGACHMPLFAG